ncbi:MAG: tetraacyldisaccharide 4'-kinase [Pseudomonadota bacterium]
MRRVRSQAAQRLQSIWRRHETPPWSLRALSKAYGAVVSRRAAINPERPACPVIVVGNLTVGGSGKSPVVAELARWFKSQGHRPAMISRGYGGRAGNRPLQVQDSTRSADCGDEARMLYQQTGLPVWVCRQRALALACAVEQGANVVISDDGLQHVGLPRSFELCLIDQSLGFGNGWLLPAGPLREPLERLERVDALLYKRALDLPAPHSDWSFVLEPVVLRPLSAREPQPRLRPGDRVDAVAGIAFPEAFFSSLERGYGLELRTWPLADHQRIDSDWLNELDGPVVMTAKDVARLDTVPAREDLFVLDVRADLPAGLLEILLEHVREFNS